MARLQITFSVALDPSTVGPGSVAIVGQTGGDQSGRIRDVTLSGGGNVMLIRFMSPLANADRYTVTVSDAVRTADGRPLEGNRSREVAALVGDVNGSGSVTAGDILAVRSQAGRSVTAETARYDVNCSGEISGSDILADRFRVGTSLP